MNGSRNSVSGARPSTTKMSSALAQDQRSQAGGQQLGIPPPIMPSVSGIEHRERTCVESVRHWATDR